MRGYRTKGLVLGLALAALPALALAQSGSKRPWAKGDCSRAGFAERLGEKLELDEATTERLGESFDQYRGKARELYKEYKAVKTKLREAVEGDASEAEIEKILAEADALGESYRQLKDGHRDDVRQILGPKGYAQYKVWKQSFHSRGRGHKRMHHKRWHRPGGEPTQKGDRPSDTG